MSIGATNPAVYYADEALYGNYQFESLENIVNNFIVNFTGDDKTLGKVSRHTIVYWAKEGVREFHNNVLRCIGKVELELGDNLDVILPPDFVDYVRISWLDQKTGMFRPMSENTKYEIGTSYLQDNTADILFDDAGQILEGTSAVEIVNDRLSSQYPNSGLRNDCNIRRYSRCYNDADWNLETGRNFNGVFNFDPNKKRIHFSSTNASDIIILEYLSDGLSFDNETDISIHKKAVVALNSWINWNLLGLKEGVQEYKVQRARAKYFADKRNASARLMGIRIAQFTQAIKQNNMWFKT